MNGVCLTCGAPTNRPANVRCAECRYKALRDEKLALFDSLVDSSGGPDACWPWLGRIDRGYGRFGKVAAHHIAYEQAKGAIPAGYEADHLCHTADSRCAGGFACPHRRCVNVTHLEAVPKRINTLRGRGPTAVNARKAMCSSGHLFTAENTYRTPAGGRACRACNREAARRHRALAAA